MASALVRRAGFSHEPGSFPRRLRYRPRGETPLNFGVFRNSDPNAFRMGTYIKTQRSVWDGCQGKVWYGLYLWASLILIGLPGCASKPQEGITDEMAAEGHALFGGTAKASAAADEPSETAGTQPPGAAKTGTTKGGQRAGSTNSTPDSGWAIALEYLSGPDHEKAAAHRRVALARELGRDDISIRNRVDGSVVVLGSYPAVANAGAQADLELVRAFRRGNALPFARAYLLPPKAEGSVAVARGDWDLAGVRATPAGADHELTLQIAVFDGSGNLDRARRDAEVFTEKLRNGGEDAYFFHGPTLSVVTVGLFDSREADAAGRPSSSAARAAQRAHPLNLRNGTTPITDPRGESQPSALMRLP